MKKTAIEWLVERLAENGILHSSDISKAKEMEKQQIENAFNYGQFDLGMEAEQYYNQTFKSE
jgi:hypothetical protein